MSFYIPQPPLDGKQYRVGIGRTVYDELGWTNPYEPAPFWRWTGFWSFVLALLEWAGEQVAAIQDPPRWASLVAVALPFAVRLARERARGFPLSFRARPWPKVKRPKSWRELS